MRNCLYIVLFFVVLGCSSETTNEKRSNDIETYHRLNFVNLVLPTEYQPLTTPEIFGPEYEWLTDGLNLNNTTSKAIFYKKGNDELLSIIQIETKGRRVTMNGENYNEFLEVLKKGIHYMPISINSNKVIEDRYDIESNPKYFKVKSLLSTDEGEMHFTCYLITNTTRTIGMTVWNLSKDQSDLENFVKRFELF